MANGLISGFQAGMSAFKPLLEHKLRMKELGKQQRFTTSEREGTQAYGDEQRKRRFSHERSLTKDKQQFDREMQQSLQYHQETMQRTDISSKEKLQKLAQRFKKTDNAAARAASLKMLREQIKATSQEKGLDREQARLLTKLDRRLRKSEGQANREVQRDLSKDTTHRTKLGIASNEKMQGQRIEAEEDAQGREFGQRQWEQKFGAKADRKARKLTSSLAKQLATHRSSLEGSRVERVAGSMASLRADYHKGMAALSNPGLSEEEKIDLHAQVEAIRDIITTTNNTAHTISQSGNVADFDKLMEWYDTGVGDRPNPGSLGRAVPRPEDSYGLGGGGQPTSFTPGAFGNPAGQNQRILNALGGSGPSAVPPEYQNRRNP